MRNFKISCFSRTKLLERAFSLRWTVHWLPLFCIVLVLPSPFCSQSYMFTASSLASFLPSAIYCLCIYVCLIVCLCMATLTEVFPCFPSVVWQMPRYNPQRRGTARTLPNFCVVLCIDCFVTLSVLFVCICVLNYCHQVATQMQLNISYHM